MREQAIDGVRSGSMGVAKDGYDALAGIRHGERVLTVQHTEPAWCGLESVDQPNTRYAVWSAARSRCCAVRALALTTSGVEGSSHHLTGWRVSRTQSA